MSEQEIADRLVALCRKGEWVVAQRELYHPDILSHEPESSNIPPSTGIDAIFEKNKQWMSMTEEIHGWSVSDPIVADGCFACTMTNDVTLKGVGRIQSTELCVYHVNEGKIVKEQFFHSPIEPDIT